VRERDRRMYTVVWVIVTALAATIMLVLGKPFVAAALVLVCGAGLVAFLRVTHPGGDHKPHLGIFFDESATGDQAPAPVDRDAVPAPTPSEPAGAEVIALRHEARRERPAAQGTAAGAAPEEVVVDEAVASASDRARIATEGSADLAAHHVRLLQQVQVKLRDYE
jgi:hypothetical protein